MRRGHAGGSGSGGSEMEEAAGGRVLLTLPGVSVPLPLPPRLLQGQLRVLQGPQDLELHWEPLEGPWELPEDSDPPDPGFEPDWAVLSPPRARKNPGWAGGFRFRLGALRGLRRGPPGLSPPSLELLPRGGGPGTAPPPAPPPLHLPRPGLRKLLRTLGPHLSRCPRDPRLLLLVTPEDPPEPPPSPSLVTRWLQGPCAATLGGLGRFLGGPRGGEGPDPDPEPPFEILACVRLGPRPSPSRGPPLARAEWGRGLDPEVLRERIFRGGLSPELRPQGWRILLGLEGWGDPEGTPKTPEGTPKTPEGTPKTPKASEGTPKTPEGTPKITEGTPKMSEGTPKMSEGTLKGPEGTPKTTGGTPKTPKTSEGTPKMSEGTLKMSEGTLKGPEGTLKGPGVSPKGPGVSPEGPGVSPEGPGVTPKGPRVTPEGPGVTPEGPGVSPRRPEGTLKGPEGTPKGPGVSPRRPEGTLKGPEGTPKGPGVTPEGPEGTPKGPEGTPKGPGVSPEGPGVSPKGPGVTPKGPRVTPEGPGLSPKGPGVSPRRPEGIPETEQARRDDYFRMKLQWRSLSPGQLRRNKILRGYQEQMERDLARAPPSVPPSLLRDVLMTFCMFHFDLGYSPGMLELLPPLAGVAPDEVETFWEFCSVLGMVGENFGPGPEGLRRKLGELGALVRVLNPGLSPLLGWRWPRRCCSQWLQFRFQRQLGLEGTRRLWEVLWTGLPCPNFHLLVTCALLELLGDTWGQPGDSPGDSDSDGDTAQGDTDSEDSDGDKVSPVVLEVGEVLSRAEGMFLQLANATDVPPALQELLGLGGDPEPPRTSP